MKTRSASISAAVIASLAAGVPAAYRAPEMPAPSQVIVIGLQADEGVPHNLVTAMKADEGVPHNLIIALQADDGVPQNLVTA